MSWTRYYDGPDVPDHQGEQAEETDPTPLWVGWDPAEPGGDEGIPLSCQEPAPWDWEGGGGWGPNPDR